MSFLKWLLSQFLFVDLIQVTHMLSYCLPIHVYALASYNSRCSLNVCPLDGSRVTYRWIDRADKKASNVIKLFLLNFLLAIEGKIQDFFLILPKCFKDFLNESCCQKCCCTIFKLLWSNMCCENLCANDYKISEYIHGLSVQLLCHCPYNNQVPLSSH